MLPPQGFPSGHAGEQLGGWHFPAVQTWDRQSVSAPQFWLSPHVGEHIGGTHEPDVHCPEPQSFPIMHG